MTNRSRFMPSLASVFASAIIVASFMGVSGSLTAYAQTKPDAKPEAKPSEAEAQAAMAVQAGPDATAKLTLAEAFIKKYPKSSARPDVAGYMANEISRVDDAGQRLILAERYQKAFTSEAELERIRPILIDAYARGKRVDEAFTMGAAVLAKQPDNIEVLTTLAIAGTDEVKRQNNKYSEQTLQYGLKAIELIEGNKKPANFEDARWTYQTSLLPHLYLHMGALAVASGKMAEAKPRLEKAIALNPTDPTGYVFLGGVVDEEYTKAAEAFQALPAGSEKQEALRKATELMDKVIDLYARALGAASDKPEFKKMYDQVTEAITPYYKYRHNRSTTGLQELIDKYKTPAKP